MWITAGFKLRWGVFLFPDNTNFLEREREERPALKTFERGSPMLSSNVAAYLQRCCANFFMDEFQEKEKHPTYRVQGDAGQGFSLNLT